MFCAVCQLNDWDSFVNVEFIRKKEKRWSREFFKFINNPWRENKGNHYREGGLDMWSWLSKFGELLLWICLKIINALRSYIKHSIECFIRYRKTSKLVGKNSAAPRFFNPLLSVWISDETLFLVFDILLPKLKGCWDLAENMMSK